MVSMMQYMMALMGLAVGWAAPEEAGRTAEGQAVDVAPAEPAASGGSEPAAAPGIAGEITNADELLEALETAEGGLQTYRAGNVRYTTIFVLEGDVQQRIGSLAYDTGRDEQGERAGPRRFALEFEGARFGERIDRERGERYVFDGQRLLELRPQEKQAIVRELVAPGEDFDPLDVGNSPFFVPIGQSKNRVLSRFEAELVPPEQGLGGSGELAPLEGLKPFVEGTYQLRLTPREGVDLGDTQEIRVWYDRQTLLPKMAKVQDLDSHQVVELRQGEVNPDLPQDAFSTQPPPRGDGWDVQIVDDRSTRGGEGA